MHTVSRAPRPAQRWSALDQAHSGQAAVLGMPVHLMSIPRRWTQLQHPVEDLPH